MAPTFYFGDDFEIYIDIDGINDDGSSWKSKVNVLEIFQCVGNDGEELICISITPIQGGNASIAVLWESVRFGHKIGKVRVPSWNPITLSDELNNLIRGLQCQ